MSQLFHTPLHDWHLAHGAKMAPFAGWDMPIQYQGIIAEHLHTRQQAGLFDICHMGEFLLAGPGAAEALARCVSHNLATLKEGRCRYGFLLNSQGGIIDDCIIYHLEPDSFMIVVNGARTAIDFATLQERLPDSLQFQDVSAETAKLDLQGPLSLSVLEKVLGRQFHELAYFASTRGSFDGAPLLISRTGYTGELGFELYLPTHKALPLWEALLADSRVQPVGLGARDTLRLEMGLPLYGQDLDEEHTPAEAGYEAMLTSPADYVGKGADRRCTEVLVPLVMEGRRSARHHDLVCDLTGRQVGRVTSGSFAPSLGHAVALAYVSAADATAERFQIHTARAVLEARREALPFYKSGTARLKLQADRV